MQDQDAIMQRLNWDNYRFILAIYRCKTIAAAARSLGVNETTVSRRLAHTEKYLQFKLFSRSGVGLVPTDSGIDLLQRIESVKTEFDAVEAQASVGQSQVVGTVRIAGDSLLIDHVLVPQLSRVLAEFPELRVELLSSVSGEQTRDADICVQYGEPSYSAHRSTILLGSVQYAAFAADTDYKVAASSSIPWVACHRRSSACIEMEGAGTQESSEELSLQRILVDNSVTQLACLYAGLGKAMLPLGVGLHDPRLKRLDSEESVFCREIWLSCQVEYLNTPRAQVCARWLEECVAISNSH